MNIGLIGLMGDLRNIIRQLAQPDGETVPLVCTVDAVDKTARTIDCTPLNENAPLLGVNLQANQSGIVSKGRGICRGGIHRRRCRSGAALHR